MSMGRSSIVGSSDVGQLIEPASKPGAAGFFHGAIRMNQENKSATKRQAERAGKVRLLTASERAELRRDMAEASTWMRAELARRRAMNK